MTLRKKVLWIISLIILVLIAILYITSRTIVLKSFTDLETEYVSDQTKRIRSVLFDTLAALNTLAADWATWDDTYAFVKDSNSNYIKVNLVNDTFVSMKVSLLIFVNDSGQIVWSKAFDLYLKEEIPLPPELETHLTVNSPLRYHPNTESSMSGILMLSKGPMLIVSRPILTSEKQGPIRGTLIMGRLLDMTEINRLAMVTHTSLTLYQFNQTDLPDNVALARSALSLDTPIFVQPLSAKAIAGYVLIADIYGKPGIILRMDDARDIYEQGKLSVFYFMSSVLIISVILGGAILVLLEKLVLSRLTRLSESVRGISVSGDLSIRITANGNDELSHFAETVNTMLAALERTQSELRDSESRYRTLVETSPDAITLTGVQGNLLMANQRAAALYGYERVEEFLTQETRGRIEMGGLQEEASLMDGFLENTNTQHIECTLFKKDGAPFPAEISTSAIVDADGKPTAFIDIIRDITERKQAEKKLETYRNYLERLVAERTAEMTAVNEHLQREISNHQQTEQKLAKTTKQLQHIFHFSPVVMYSCHSSGTYSITFISENITAHTGYAPHEFIETPDFWMTHIHPEDQIAVLEKRSHLYEEGYCIHEYRLQRKDGKYNWVCEKSNLVRDAHGNPLEIIGSWIILPHKEPLGNE